GEGLTGGNPGMKGSPAPMQQPQQNADAKINQLRERAQANPDDIDNLADIAGEMIKIQAFDDAFPIVARASGIDPFHVQTRIWRAVLDAVDGQPLPALDELEHLASTYDGAYKARLYAGLVAMETKQERR